MTFNEQLHQALSDIRDGKLRDRSVEQLHCMLQVLRQYLEGSPNSQVGRSGVQAIESELSRRPVIESRAEAVKHHQQVMEEQAKIREAVQSLKEPHWSLTPGFIVIFVTMIFAAIAAWPVIREWFPKHEPAKTSSGFQSPISNSTPAIPAVPQTSAPAISAIRGTNQP